MATTAPDSTDRVCLSAPGPWATEMLTQGPASDPDPATPDSTHEGHLSELPVSPGPGKERDLNLYYRVVTTVPGSTDRVCLLAPGPSATEM